MLTLPIITLPAQVSSSDGCESSSAGSLNVATLNSNDSAAAASGDSVSDAPKTETSTALSAHEQGAPGERDHNGKLYIETVGCQMNMLDSELVVAALRREGYELTSQPDDADTILFNTCSVREHAEHKIYSALGRLKHARKQRPQQVIGVMGCMAQKDQSLIFDRAPHVDIVVGTGQMAEIPGLIKNARKDRERALAVSLDRKAGTRREVSASFQSYDPLREPEMRPSPYQAFVRIMFGCDKFCTYCVVPMTRGPEQSRLPSEILAEVAHLAGQGVKEVTLLGQTVNSYKCVENGKTWRLSDLLAAMHETPGMLRFKFVTSYPRDMTDDLLIALRDLPKCSHYIHVPLQHGCDDVLTRMKRGYTTAHYREMHQRIKEYLPYSAVSSDFIVGFCGETEESHQKSLEAIREYRFKNSFIFKYSERPGTKAQSLFQDDIPDEVKKRRNQELLELQNEISEEDNAAFIGREVEVLVEGPSKNAIKKADSSLKEQLTGRTRCDRIVVFDGNPRLAGSLAQVVVHDVTPTTLVGSILTREVQHGGHSLLPILV
ncbi:tRNA (N6-isopentenyl adenosine(37)-C2)-methylthiotransferase MiaB [Planctopirus limnophila]|uniref:tRNA (N6-isopentenyl adenosine(37)-C2)-methylthiotransferase MiaB n=1 Tax=Planctopirus limnophila TaxID=120 RepID=UPI0001A30D1E|nr:tRNA (N6-isopentenyl adenosine(37)-C2)-methylthiotransferase MiaB [Planctopirus limnophila]